MRVLDRRRAAEPAAAPDAVDGLSLDELRHLVSNQAAPLPQRENAVRRLTDRKTLEQIRESDWSNLVKLAADERLAELGSQPRPPAWWRRAAGRAWAVILRSGQDAASTIEEPQRSTERPTPDTCERPRKQSRRRRPGIRTDRALKDTVDLVVDYPCYSVEEAAQQYGVDAAALQVAVRKRRLRNFVITVLVVGSTITLFVLGAIADYYHLFSN